MRRFPLPGECNACYLYACHHCELPSRCTCSRCHPSIKAEPVVSVSASPTPPRDPAAGTLTRGAA
jgi:hypothetical protein